MLSNVCLGVLIILVYSTIMFNTCDMYQENQLCPQRNLAFRFHLNRDIAGRNVYKSKASYIEDSVTKIQNLTKHMPIIGCVLQMIIYA